MTDATNETQPSGDRFFRRTIGYLCIAGSLAGFLGLYVVEVPEANKDAMMFALGIVFGWGSMVVSSEYGVTTTGRKVAESVVRKIEREDIAATESPPGGAAPLNDPSRPAGTAGDPVHVEENKP